MAAQVFAVATLLAFTGLQAADPMPPGYTNDFTRAEIGKVPEDILVLDGQFAVQQDGDNRFLELPGAPLETYGLLFGPADKDGLAVGARVFGTSKGRRFPTFGISLGGASGYRLQVAPGRKQLELLKGDQVLTAVPFAWDSGKWTHLELQLRKLAPGGWRIEGKAWPQAGGDDKEPDHWMIATDEKAEPTPGRSGVWGSPFSGTPIRFDDLIVKRVSETP
jgi:hypothetical protein